jgi:hypothetical protein
MNERFQSRQESRPDAFSKQEITNMVRRTSAVNNEHQLDMSQFIDTYGLEKVTADYAKVADRMASHLEGTMSDSEKLGHIFEAAYLDLATRHSWFGEHSEITKASKFDDIMNGVDMITTVLDKTNSVRQFEVATDLTISSHGVVKKFTQLADKVREGELAEINYYHSDILGYTGRLRDVPKTLIALDPRNMQSFLRNWMQEPELAQEQFSQVMLQQIATQSQGFARLAKNTHGSGSRIFQKYTNTRNVCQEILETGPTYDLPEDKSSATIEALSSKIGR